MVFSRILVLRQVLYYACNKDFTEVDLDGNGVITLDEFATIYSMHAQEKRYY